MNEYRPHQGRETLIEMVAEQINRRREEIEGVKRMQVKVEEVLGGLEHAAALADDQANKSGAAPQPFDDQATERERMRDVWTALEEIQVDI